MATVTARTKINGKSFEIKVDLDEALKVQSGSGSVQAALESSQVFSDIKKGEVAGQSDLQAAFNSSDLNEVAEQIIKKGEVQKTQEFRDSEKEAKLKQIIQLVIKNATDQHGKPYTEDRISTALKEIHFNPSNKPADQQLPDLVKELQKIIPIKIETKRIKITIPAQYTGQVYGLLKDFKESEEWLSNGALEAILNIPAGMQVDFYDKLNSFTHGAVQSEELQEKV